MVKMECNFSYKHYFEVLKKAKKEYAIGPVRDFKKLKKNKKYIILRHDIDVSLDQAVKIAEKEASYKIFSTYFILLHSPYYNAFDENSYEKICKISDLGHEIGLHYDISFLKKYSGSIINNIKDEADILSKISNSKITSIAQHDPTYSPKLNEKVLIKFLDVKDKKLNQDLKYLSDSVQNWRSGCMCQHIGKVDKLQILTHPIWWSNENYKKEKILELFVNQNKKSLTKKIDNANKFYDKYLLESNRKKKN
jgi:hypothetical protein